MYQSVMHKLLVEFGQHVKVCGHVLVPDILSKPFTKMFDRLSIMTNEFFRGGITDGLRVKVHSVNK